MKSSKHTIIPQMLSDLEQIGIQRGDLLLVHSSFKALGPIDYSPSDVIHTMLQFLGTEGTLMMPTFTYSYSGITDIKPFHLLKTPGVSNGILTETLRKFPGTLRSAHPTYSVAASGKYAPQITQNKENATPLGRGSSYDIAYQSGAKVLLLGVCNNRNSMLHYAEVVSDVPYNNIPFRAFWGKTALVEKDDHTVEVPLSDEFPGCSANFGVADAFFEEKKIMSKEKICSADSLCMNAKDIVAAAVDKFKEQPDWLLCDNFTCEPCSLRKKRLKQAGMLG
jgi:aminoglycoside 3-N-acetyltransferase